MFWSNTRKETYYLFFDNCNEFVQTTLYTGVRLKVKGECKVRWSESHGTGKNRRTRTYWAEELYMDEQVYLAGSREFGFELILFTDQASSVACDHSNDCW